MPSLRLPLPPLLLAAALGCAAATALAADAPDEDVSFHAQATAIGQRHPGFPAQYSGANSLFDGRETRNSVTGTLFIGTRLWPGGELYFDPEVALGRGFSGVLGLAGFPNGESAKVGSPDPTFYTARFFIRHTVPLSGDVVALEPDQNQLADHVAASRFVFTAGKFSALDIFDDNPFSHEPRTQFTNWALVTGAAWDFPADARGYTKGLAVEWINPVWSLRAASFAEPAEANGLRLDPKLSKAHGEVVEVERKQAFDGLAGSVRVLAFANHAHMGSYREALAMAAAPGVPDVVATRAYRTKKGAAINIDQKLAATVGAFLRAGFNDGRTESWAYTEVDRSLSGGLSVDGAAWGRAKDVLGIAAVRNGLSRDHRNYLAAGGIGFITGDGRLNYAAESIAESYYSIGVAGGASLTLGWQHFRNPAYNRDRGPVDVLSGRVHYEF